VTGGTILILASDSLVLVTSNSGGIRAPYSRDFHSGRPGHSPYTGFHFGHPEYARRYTRGRAASTSFVVLRLLPRRRQT
jgi:hypothetical protein